MALHLQAMTWGLLVAVLAAVAEAIIVRRRLQNVSHGTEAFNSSIPRGDGQAVCNSWVHSELREERIKPYIKAISGGSVPTQGVFEELDFICGINGGGAPMGDVDAYETLHAYIENNRQTPAVSPFTAAYYSEQADEVKALVPGPLPKDFRLLDYGCGDGFMLSVFHRKLKVPAENLHCIELHDMVPDERKGDFQLHVLQDPIADLELLSKGSLKGYFDVVSSFAVFHHIPDKAVRASVLSSISLMLKPKAMFLLADWSSYDKPHFDVWYDVAHVLLWLFMGSAPPGRAVDIGTQYAGLSTYIALAGNEGLSPEKEYSSSKAETDASPLGHFAQVFMKSGNVPIGTLANTGENHATRGEGLTHAMPLG